MTRPLAPKWFVAPFAPDANYPPGATFSYEGTATKASLSDAGTIGFTPGAVTAQKVNFYFNHLADRKIKERDLLTDIVAWVDRAPALSFIRLANDPSTVGATWEIFSNGRDLWTCGFTNLHSNVAVSHDRGLTWTRIDQTSGGIGVFNGAVDPLTNNVCIACIDSGGGDLVVINYLGNNTPVLKTLFSSGVEPQGPAQVVWDPINGKFVYLCVDSVSKCFTSPTGAAWTDAAVPHAWGNVTGFQMGINPSSGRIVAVRGNAIPNHTCSIATTDDAGQTWVIRDSVIDTVVGSSSVHQLSYLADTNTWLLVVGGTTVKTSELWKSTDDGTTWSKVRSFSSCLLAQVAAVDSLWVAGARFLTTTEVVYSADAGVTWYRSGIVIGAADIQPRIISVGGGFCIVADNHDGGSDVSANGHGAVYISERAGLPVDAGTVS